MRFFILFVISFSLSSPLFSQILVTNNITVDDGLSYSEVTCAYKDHRNILWLGTSSGLSEWNSVEFKNYYGEDGLPSSFIKSICEDENGVLFVATDEGLVYKKDERFLFPENLPNELKSKINDVYLSRNNKLYILSENSGLWIKDKNGFHNLELDSEKNNFIPISILERKNGDILIGTRSGGIYQITGNKIKRIIFEPVYKKFPVVDLVELSNDSLYVALQGFGLILYDNINKTKTVLSRRNGLPSNIVNDLQLDSKNKLFVATTNGIAIVVNNKISKILTQKNGLQNEFILKVFSLNEDGAYLFLSAGNGFYTYQENSFATYNKSIGLLHNNVWRIKELKDGSFCFLTDEGISLFKNNHFRSITTKNGLGDNLVVSLFEDSTGNLYVSTYSDGVNLIKGNKIKRLNRKIGMFENTTCTIEEYNKDTLFFITRSKGIAVFDGKKIIDTLTIGDGILNPIILSSLKKHDGTIVVSVKKDGLYKYKNKKFIKYLDDIKDCSIWAIYEDERDNLYLGTNEKGIIKCYPDGRRDTVNVSTGLSNNVVVSITGDDYGNIYAGTDRGLNIIKFSAPGKFKVRQLFKQSGLANSECNQGALYKDKEGNVWVGTIGGVTKINPAINDNSESDTPIIFTSVKILDKSIPFSDSLNDLKLNYYDNDITFKFVGLNYLDPQIVKYKYKLKNADRKWNIDNKNEIRYAKLPPGEYKFMVAANNNWGIWSKPVSISFEIAKPFWQTWQFTASLFVLAVLIVYSILNYRLKNIMRLEKLRSKISADLHDEIGSGLSEISILSELLKYNKTFDDKLINGLDQIGDSTRKLIKSLSDIIWIVNPKEESLGDLINRIQNTYQEVFFHAKINLHINYVEKLKEINLPLEVRQNLYLIIKEAVNNALKYSKGKNIFINIKKLNQYLVFEIIDDGVGLKKEDHDKGNGLYNMRKRAETINAGFAIESDQNGTKVIIKIPIKRSRIKWLK